MIRQLNACVCRFKRAEDTPWETGIAVGNEIDRVQLIIDGDGKALEGVPWNYILYEDRGCFVHSYSEFK